MKKTVLGLLLLTATAASAQIYKPFKVNASVGFALPTASYNKADGVLGGLTLMSLEPRYAFNDRFELGIRGEVVDLQRAVFVTLPGGGAGSSGQDGTGTSLLLTANYFIKTNSALRPYVGLGAGAYWAYATSVRDVGPIVNGVRNSNIVVDSQSDDRVGGMARIGAKIGHVNVAAEYNYAAPTAYFNKELNARNSNSYVGLKAGFDIGGGRR